MEHTHYMHSARYVISGGVRRQWCSDDVTAAGYDRESGRSQDGSIGG